MILIVGGACQGKRDFAKNKFPGLTWADGRICEEADLFRCQGIHHFHIYIKRLMEETAQEDRQSRVDLLVERLWRENREAVILADEVGCGIVPLEALERAWRETAGRACTYLAARADRVYRVVCGIGTVIKG